MLIAVSTIITGCITFSETLVYVSIIENTNTCSILGGVRMTERQKRMKELLIQSDAEITDQILSAVLAKFGTRPAGLSRPDPAQEVCPSFPKS